MIWKQCRERRTVILKLLKIDLRTWPSCQDLLTKHVWSWIRKVGILMNLSVWDYLIVLLALKLPNGRRGLNCITYLGSLGLRAWPPLVQTGCLLIHNTLVNHLRRSNTTTVQKLLILLIYVLVACCGDGGFRSCKLLRICCWCWLNGQASTEPALKV